MSIITLTTDMGLKDYYAGVLKGSILRQLPDATIIDISHDVTPFMIQEAAFVVRNAYKEFPEKTIHIVGVEPDATDQFPHVAIYADGHYFIGADNGMFSMIFDKKPDQIVELGINQESEFLTFPTKDIFVPAACHIARGGTLEVLGKPRADLNQRIMFNPTYQDNWIMKGMVIYEDNYHNVITNISKKAFDDFGKGRRFMICFRDEDYNLNMISKSYSDVPEGERMALFGATGYLEIAVKQGKASKLLGLRYLEPIRIEFYD